MRLGARNTLNTLAAFRMGEGRMVDVFVHVCVIACVRVCSCLRV